MSFTVQQAIDRGRIPLNDVDKDRYTDVDLLVYAQDAYLLAFRHRPDLFIGRFSLLTSATSLALGSTFPMDDQYLPFVADYITGRAEMLDDEFVNSGRAQSGIASFLSGLGAP
jgi:hypothetical protein